jgi:hypothetical protein
VEIALANRKAAPGFDKSAAAASGTFQEKALTSLGADEAPILRFLPAKNGAHTLASLFLIRSSMVRG